MLQEVREMRSHVAKTVRACFAALRQLRSVRRSVPRPVLQSLVSSLVLYVTAGYGNGSLVSASRCASLSDYSQ